MRRSISKIGIVSVAAIVTALLVGPSCGGRTNAGGGTTGGNTGDGSTDGAPKSDSSIGGIAGSGGNATDGGGGSGGSAGGVGATGGSSTGGVEAGTCNPDTCPLPTPVPPAVKCCAEPDGPCGIDYGEGAGCQTPFWGDF